MKTIFFTTAAALIAIANPANAQILGGSGGGILGGGASVVPSLPSLPTMPAPMNPVGSVTNASSSATGSATANKSVNTRTGQANANGSATGQLDSTLNQTVSTPTRSLTTGLTGSANASGSANGSAQLIGTDGITATTTQVRDAAGNTVSTVRDRLGNTVSIVRDRAGNTITTIRDRAGNLVSSVREKAGSTAAASGSAQGSGQGSATGEFAGLSQNLALAGSAAVDATGSFDIKPGTQLFDMAGEKIGKVREVVADSTGHVKALVVKVDDTVAMLPANDFAANGKKLVTSLSETQIDAAGDLQANASASGTSSATGKADAGK